MRNLLILLILTIHLIGTLPAKAADRELNLARDMLEDAVVRDVAEGMRMARERLLCIVAAGDDRAVLRDAHYLIALSAVFQYENAYLDLCQIRHLALPDHTHNQRPPEITP